ncbi:MAG: type I-B CRISPR-associated protein Cas7/Cst2/DevR [Nitrososphaerales archaeon]
MTDSTKTTHIAGTFLIEASGSFLNGAGLGEGEDRNVTVPKTFRDGQYRVPYVSSQAWKRWLRNTLIEETGWPPSVLKAIDLSARGTTSKIAGELNPVDFAEDDIFGYMRAEKGQGRSPDEDEIEEDESKKGSAGRRTKAVMRASPLAASILVSLRKTGWQGRDEGFVHLKEGTPLPYTTEFYNTHLQGVFCLNYSRLGVFWNVGDRIELDEDKAEEFLKSKKIRVKEDKGEAGKIYEMVDANNKRKERTTELLKALSKMRGGAKQAQFATDVSPKVLIMAGLTCGNPVFNDLFTDDIKGPALKIDTLKELVTDYSDRFTTPIFIGIRAGYLKNEEEVKALHNKNENGVKYMVTTPICAAEEISKLLP